jgi:glutamyl/glutaminyl-tRNA synthetase
MPPNLSYKKTRIAPTPSGFLHLGNVYSFALTAAIAHKYHANTLLRIDDMDRDRVEERYVQDIFDTLNFLEIGWDEGPRDITEFERVYAQRHRMDLYTHALQTLAANEHVFACVCSRSQIVKENPDGIYPGTCRDKGIPPDTKNACWRLRTRADTELTVKTTVGAVKAKLPAEMTDFVVKRKDGFPAYQLTSVVDDIHFGIDLIVRGQDLWPSTLAQLYLSSLLGQNPFPETLFHHHPLLLESTGKKLSKSEGAMSVQYLRKQYKKPADIYTLIATMLGSGTPMKNWQELGTFAMQQPQTLTSN